MQRPFILALDFPSFSDTKKFLSMFEAEELFVKVGMELYFQEGPSMISYLKEQGHSIFLDLKLHDIPNTVQSAMKGLARLGVDIVNVHAAGGTAMMQAAVEGLEAGTNAGTKRPHCIAVTQLTSTSEKVLQNEIWIEKPLNDVVLHYANLAKQSGLDGIVCSSLEAPHILDQLGTEFMTVTPGIRLTDDEKGDQSRVVSPEEARKLGSTAIVVGRSITKSSNPADTYLKMKQLWEGVTV